jgi:hypothetical protein
VNSETELEIWQREWRDRTEPMPDLKKKIRRQNLRTVAAILAVCACLAFSTVEAFRNRSYFMAGVAAGIAFASVFMGGYAWWVRRGAWKPTAQTTLAYAELCYRRALAKARTVRFAFYFLLIATVLFGIFVAWNWKHFHPRDGIVLVALVAELFFFKHFGRRKRREIEENRKLVDGLKE